MDGEEQDRVAIRLVGLTARVVVHAWRGCVEESIAADAAGNKLDRMRWMRMLFASSQQDRLRMCFLGLRDHCSVEQRGTKHVGMAEAFAGSFDRYALKSGFDAWLHRLA